MKALVYDPETEAWLQFEQPIDLLIANSYAEVRSVLQHIEDRSRLGCHCVGYVGYEAAPAFDGALECNPPGGMPLAAFGVFNSVQSGSLAGDLGVGLHLESQLAFADFSDSIRLIKQYLSDGDTYQVNFTHRLKGQCTQAAEKIFAQLISAQPSPYAAMLNFVDYSICSISPELFFEKRGNKIRTEPMKGTRPRGRTTEEDNAIEQELRSSEKDRAENLMIVDMIRNDLGRVADPGSISVDHLFAVKKLPTVWQQVSSISAQTPAGLVEVFQALFPCASVTGAPRRRTMEIIKELEDSPRGVYTGAIGLVKPDNHARFSVGIRTLVIDNEECTYGVGGGIVWDSDPMDEWRESLIKGAALRHVRPEFWLLETMRYEPGEGIWFLADHIARLKGSAEYFDFPLDEKGILQELDGICAEEPQRLRLQLSQKGQWKIELARLGTMPESVNLRLATLPVDSKDIFLFHKTTNRSVYDSRRLENCDDVILFNESGEITETTISNLFLEIRGRLLTPYVGSGLLAGTYRQNMLKTGRAKESRLLIKDLKRADRLFVANSVRGLLPATFVSD